MDGDTFRQIGCGNLAREHYRAALKQIINFNVETGIRINRGHSTGAQEGSINWRTNRVDRLFGTAASHPVPKPLLTELVLPLYVPMEHPGGTAGIYLSGGIIVLKGDYLSLALPNEPVQCE
jgi:hypothetical protein